MVREAFIPENDSEGYLFKLWNLTVPSGDRAFKEHCHLRFEIVLFKSGSGTYETASGRLDIKKGDVFVFPSNEQHCITRIDDGEPFSFMNIHFEPRYIWDSRSSGLSPENMNLCFIHGENFCNRLPRQNGYTEKVRRLMLEIEEECEHRDKEYTLMVKNRVFEILVTLIRYLDYGSGRAPSHPEYGRIRTVRTAIDYINRHLGDDLTLSEISEAVGLSPNYFSALFKETFGVGLWDYVNEKRIEKALHTIDSEQSMTMLEIAALCGFNNTANFNKTFRKFTGLSPSEYRRGGKAAMY